MQKAAIIQLCRFGDIVSILPVAKHLHDSGVAVTIITHPTFAPILSAVSYVKSYVYHGTPRDVAGAMVEAGRAGFAKEEIIPAQVDGNQIRFRGKTRNFITEQWARSGYLDKFHELPLWFDRRNAGAEHAELSTYMPPEDGRPLLSYCLTGVSSPYPHEQEQREWITGVFKNDWRLLDLGALRLASPQLLLPFLERSALLITIDTLPLHLSYATGTPAIVFSKGSDPKGNPSAYYDSEPRAHWLAQTTYDVSITEECRREIQRIASHRDFAPGRLVREMPKILTDKIIHVTDWYLGNEEDNKRITTAWKTWDALVRKDPNYHLLLHSIKPGQTTGKSIGDSKAVPYVNDVIAWGLHAADDQDIVVFTNSDVCLCGEALEEIRLKLADGPCCYSRRVDVHNAMQPRSIVDLEKIGVLHVGADLFACRASFWRAHGEELPKLFLSYEGWDWVARRFFELHHPDAEMKPPVIYHEKHSSYWATSGVIATNPAQLHNRKECERFAREHGWADALHPAGKSQYLFKSDEEWRRA